MTDTDGIEEVTKPTDKRDLGTRVSERKKQLPHVNTEHDVEDAVYQIDDIIWHLADHANGNRLDEAMESYIQIQAHLEGIHDHIIRLQGVNKQGK